MNARLDDLDVRIAVRVRDPALAAAIEAALEDVASALAAAPPLAPADVAIVHVVHLTRADARGLPARIDALRAGGVAAIQLVWDGRDRRLERHVFAALEHARAHPAAAPVVLASSVEPAAALRVLVGVRAHERAHGRAHGRST